MATDPQGKHPSGTMGATFALYKDEHGSAALWIETQNVTADISGRYTVQLGASKPDGLRAELFTSGEARWLGVSINGQAEQPRVLLLSVPYALKAADAETIDGLPPSAFVLAVPPNSNSSTTPSSGSNSNENPPSIGGTGKTNYLPIWTNSTTLGSSVLFQSRKGSKAQIGIGTTKPASTLDVNGGGTIRGLFNLPATGTATASGGFNSQPIDLAASVFNSGTSTAVPQTFQWRQLRKCQYQRKPQQGRRLVQDRSLARSANKFLYHSFVESPDMMNVYNGNVITGQRGLAIVALPDYFGALNRDFRYQLTVIGQFAQAIIARKIANNRFVIRINKPDVEVSWQVTGIRQDAYANAHRIPVEEDKPPQEQGRYLHPELFGASPKQAIGMRVLVPAATVEVQPAPFSMLAEEKQ
jgi:hypothetical protein